MSTPYYSNDLVTLYHGDCREITEWLAADVLVTDPPYGMSFRSGSRAVRHDAIAGDSSPVVRDYALTKWGERPGIVFGTWRVARPDHVKAVCIWDKGVVGGVGMGDLTLPFGSTHEEFYLVGGPWGLIGKRAGSVVTTRVQLSSANGLCATIGHPTVKPVGLMESLILTTRGVVADPFAGSGSTLLAARNLGRRAIGVEVDERYCEIAARRLDQGALDFGDAA